MNTREFAYKYGYLEARFTISSEWISNWNNLNLLAGDARAPLLHNYRNFFDHQFAFDSHEDFGRMSGSVIALFEYSPTSRYFAMQSFLAFVGTDGTDVDFRRARRNGRAGRWRASDEISFDARSNPNGDITITLGVEWTPRGHRNFYMVDGEQSEMTATPIRNELLWSRSCDEYDSCGTISLRGDAKNRHIEYLDPDDPDSYLINYAVGHAPVPIHIGAWGHNDTGVSWLDIDYIRIYQPENLYRDMEPYYG